MREDVRAGLRGPAWSRTFFRQLLVVPARVHMHECVRNVGAEDNSCECGYLCGDWKNSDTCGRVGFLYFFRLSTVRYDVDESLDESKSCVSPAESLFSSTDFALAATILRTHITSAAAT